MGADHGKRSGGTAYSEAVTGKGLFRVRETHIRDHYGPLLKAHSRNAVVLDLVLRGVAFYERDLGGRQERRGYVRWDYYYEDLFDLIRDPAHFRGGPASRLTVDASTERARKREAVRQNLKKLEKLRLVELDRLDGRRPVIHVLSDAGDGRPYDDPDGRDGRTYVSILGELIQSGVLARWNIAQLVGYFCAMIGERHDDRSASTGQGRWWRTPEWFRGLYRREGDVLMPFGERTIRTGLSQLSDDGYLDVSRIHRHPDTGRPLKGGQRNLYLNRFATEARNAKAIADEAAGVISAANSEGLEQRDRANNTPTK